MVLARARHTGRFCDRWAQSDVMNWMHCTLCLACGVSCVLLLVRFLRHSSGLAIENNPAFSADSKLRIIVLGCLLHFGIATRLCSLAVRDWSARKYCATTKDDGWLTICLEPANAGPSRCNCAVGMMAQPHGCWKIVFRDEKQTPSAAMGPQKAGKMGAGRSILLG